ncbi:TSC complex subunit 1a isoform X2 [Mastacembelus armatus]|uniref:TSC complex subunit 1a isoform X2 n=1 Tax=Mastacembelus armatus TaxID=205130 RepID=UPI000E4620CC|nr:hamartin-like isoform X2 [Mastacembelus armatus]
MSKEQVSISELLLSLDSSELQEAERVRAAVNQQLSTDRGGTVLSSLVEYYLDSSSSQVVLLLSSTREPHHKVLLEKLNESLNRPGTRLAGLTLLGHLIRKQPPWVHHISQSAVLPSLLRCLKTEGDVVVLITGVLVLITLLPMIPQAGKQHIYDFFDVFGRLASWTYRNPGHAPVSHLIHLHAGVYSLFHRLYGMFPCNFISYLRLHYSMKENLGTFQELIKPMLDHVRVHPELVTGTQDYELDPSRWKRYEVHDIVIECSRVSLDPLESSCEEDFYASLPHLDLTCSPSNREAVSSSGSSACPGRPGVPALQPSSSSAQADDVTWRPSSQCGLSTPPPELATTGSAHPLDWTASASEVTSEESHQLSSSTEPVLLTSTPTHEAPSSGSPFPPAFSSLSLYLTPPHSSTTSHRPEEGGSAAPYEPLFELALPRAAVLFLGKKTQEALERAGLQVKGGGGEGEDLEEHHTPVSPLEVLDQLIVHGHDAHDHLMKRLSEERKSVDRSQLGGSALGEDLQSLRSQVLLVHSQLQYERFKRQQHAIRNRRLLRRVINATALEEHNVAMKAQLRVQDEEICSLKLSLEEEQRRYTHLQQDAQTHSDQLHTHIRQLLQQQQDEQREQQRLQRELQECQSRVRDLEAELQRANNKAYNAEHQLAQLSLKLCSSEQLQQQMFVLNQQLVLLRETNRALTEQLEGGAADHCTEAAMLQCSVGKEYERLKDSEVLQRQRMEAASHRIAELENQLTKKEQLILDQKKLLEDTKAQSRAELSACDARCVALRRVTQTLQTEMLHLYSQLHLDVCSRPNGGSVTLPVPEDSLKPHPSSSSVGIINGEVLSTSPLHLPSCSSSPLSLSPIDSPLAIGSFLEQRARQLFRPADHSQEEAKKQEEEEQQEEVAQPESPTLGQEVEEAPESEPAGQAAAPLPPTTPADLTLAVQQRRHELSIMDYDETLPEY